MPIPQSLTLLDVQDAGSTYDYIIVGSGAGGGPLAARLALANYRVLLIEAGSDLLADHDHFAEQDVTLVPALHAASTEHRDLTWQFFVKHYENPTEEDSKWDKAGGGIFYPRAAALGGCTVHNAMITIAGPDSDWDDLAYFLDDDTWRASAMRRYFQRLERNDYALKPRPIPRRWWSRAWENLRWLFGHDPDYTGGRHGFGGWLRTSVTDVAIGLEDRQLVKMLKAALWQAKQARLERAWTLVRTFLKGKIRQSLDPNHAHTQSESPEGLALVPLAVCGHSTTVDQNSETPFVQRGRRSGPREFILEVKAGPHGQNLKIQTDCLVTNVIFDDAKTPRAIGIEYLEGKRLYRAHPKPGTQYGKPGKAYATREVILCAGAFNTPQLLMLSGIGDPMHLSEHGIKCRVPLPGVGCNLQDRYEVTVLTKMKRPFRLLDGATFTVPKTTSQADPHWREWKEHGTGLYTSNGAVLGILKRSRPDLAQPDLFMFGIPLPFYGYKVKYSEVPDRLDLFTWAILKSHTQNHDGAVRLRTSDPRDTPEINFHYFNEKSRSNSTDEDPDLVAMLDGVKFVRGIARNARRVSRLESYPGEEVYSDEGIKRWIRREAWGHHACGTCRMGTDGDPYAVLDSRFRVRGVNGLRVVDASIFPTIPGYFIVTNIYMASEKAADVILEDAQ